MDKKGKMNIWDVIAWLALFGIVLWLILKVTGIIATPLWLEYAPIFAAVYIAGRAMHKLDVVHDEVVELKRFKDATINEINNIKMNCIKKHNN